MREPACSLPLPRSASLSHQTRHLQQFFFLTNFPQPARPTRGINLLADVPTVQFFSIYVSLTLSPGVVINLYSFSALARDASPSFLQRASKATTNPPHPTPVQVNETCTRLVVDIAIDVHTYTERSCNRSAAPSDAGFRPFRSGAGSRCLAPGVRAEPCRIP